jgi:hypothetical protein
LVNGIHENAPVPYRRCRIRAEPMPVSATIYLQRR